MKYREAIEYLLTTHVQWDVEDPNIEFMCSMLSHLRDYKTLWLEEQSNECKKRLSHYQSWTQ